MDTHENEQFPQENNPVPPIPEQPPVQQPMQQLPQPQQPPVWQQPPQPQQPPQGFYHGAGAGYREPFASYSFAQPQQNPDPGYYQPWQQPVAQQPQPPAQEPAPKPAKKQSNIGMRILAAVIAFAVLIGCCCITALVMHSYMENRLREQNELLQQYFAEKSEALQQQVDAQIKDMEGSGGQLETSSQALTAAQIYAQNADSVVAITCIIQVNDGDQVQQGGTAGSGFVLTSDGYVVTNHHVINGATQIKVTMHDGSSFAATVVGSDDTNDIALLKMDATGLQPVKIGSSSALKVGDQVVAIGNALGELSASLTVGYVSGMDRDISTDGTIINMLQTDVAINSGNSGGPLFNARGEVIGITTAKYSGTTSSGATIEGISFAIPINDVIGMLEDLREFGYIKSAYLGVMVRDVDPSVAEMYGLPQGAYVDSVTFDSCALKAGIRPRDIIVELGGYPVENLGDLSRALRQFEAGESATVVVWRGGQRILLNIVFDEKPHA